MTSEALAPEALEGGRFGLIADAHIHPGDGPDLPGSVPDAFREVDAIICLGDMGEAAGLDRLESLAPIIAVRGADDAGNDDRVARQRRMLEERQKAR